MDGGLWLRWTAATVTPGSAAPIYTSGSIGFPQTPRSGSTCNGEILMARFAKRHYTCRPGGIRCGLAGQKKGGPTNAPKQERSPPGGVVALRDLHNALQCFGARLFRVRAIPGATPGS